MRFLQQLFSDAPGVSFGRVATAISLVAAICWVTWVVYKTAAVPALDGITMFALSFYGTGKLLGKAAEILGKRDSGLGVRPAPALPLGNGPGDSGEKPE